VSRVDLHIHSNASDGKYSPDVIVRMAAELGLRYISLTDHDSVEGIPTAVKAAQAFPALTFIPGVEISTDAPDGEVHILGYFIDFNAPEMKESLKKFQNNRLGRAREMIDKLAKFGVIIDWERVKQLAGDASVGRPHIARAMLEKGYINSFEDAFHKYIGHGGPAYVERDKLAPEEAVGLILRSHGLPVLAHPFTVNNPKALVKKLKPAGLIGLEAYYKDASLEATQNMLKLAEAQELIATGGTDYHGMGENNEVPIGGVNVPLKAAEDLIAMAGKNAR
jgi:predicted metal-dependent phosphoesterase TrpH